MSGEGERLILAWDVATERYIASQRISNDSFANCRAIWRARQDYIDAKRALSRWAKERCGA